MLELTPSLLLDLMANQRYGVEYQPLLDPRSREVFAYEALSRFYLPDGQSLPPHRVYAALHDNPLSLFQVELQLKHLQLIHAPTDSPVFVNLDQDAYHACGRHGSDNPFLQLIRDHAGRTTVVELIENTEINDALVSMTMINAFAELGVPTAIDDVGAPHSMISLAIIQRVEYLKFDRHLLRERQDEQTMALVRALMDFARQTGKQVVFEGIESETDLEYARRLGADYVQGYLFRDRFIHAE